MPMLATAFRKPFDGSLTLTNDWGDVGGLKDYPTFKHLGEDYAGAKGTPILATANGKVVTAAANHASFGNYVVLEHTLADQTKVYSLYAHMASLSVSSGQEILMGAKVGGLGNTGAADGYHLHFEISYVNRFTDSGIYGKGYDSPTEFTTSSLKTVDPSKFIAAHAVSNVQAGGSGGDSIWGLSSGELIHGYGGNDFLYGNGGRDTVVGGTGKDYLYGGIDNDAFVFNSIGESVVGANRDVIGDFHSGDKVDLRGIDASTRNSGDQAFKYIGNQSFHRVAGELSMSAGIIKGDVNGDGAADFEIQVVGVSTLTSNDFLL